MGLGSKMRLGVDVIFTHLLLNIDFNFAHSWYITQVLKKINICYQPAFVSSSSAVTMYDENVMLSLKQVVMQVFIFPFPFSHLADALIQSDLQ